MIIDVAETEHGANDDEEGFDAGRFWHDTG